MAFAFEKLSVYQVSVDFADQVCLRSENFACGSVQECVSLVDQRFATLRIQGWCRGRLQPLLQRVR
jgi:hypothetical protein